MIAADASPARRPRRRVGVAGMSGGLAGDADVVAHATARVSPTRLRIGSGADGCRSMRQYRRVEALRAIDGWDARVRRPASPGRRRCRDPRRRGREFPWASVTKLLTGLAVLVALEEGTVDLDEPAGPPGSTLRHLLAHASGLPLDGGSRSPSRAAAASTRTPASSSPPRSSPTRAEMPFADYFAQAVAGRSGSRGALGRLARPRLPRPARRPARARPRAPAADPRRDRDAGRGDDRPVPGPRPASCPASGRWSRTTGASTFELRDAKSPHWTGTRNSARTFGHFGASGTFLWVDPDAGLACGVLTDRRVRRLGEGGVAPLQRRGARGALGVVGEERPQQLVERRAVAARDHRGSHRRHRRRPRDVHRRRHLAEVVARPSTLRAPRSRWLTARTPARRTKKRSSGSPSRTRTVPGATSWRSMRWPSAASVSPGNPASNSIRVSSCWVAERRGEALSSSESLRSGRSRS